MDAYSLLFFLTYIDNKVHTNLSQYGRIKCKIKIIIL